MSEFLGSQTSSETRRAYERALRQFVAWHNATEDHDHAVCPTHEEMHAFADYLEASGLKVGSVTAKLAAVSGWLDHSDPPGVENVARGVRTWPAKPPDPDPWGDALAGSDGAEFCWQCGKWRLLKHFDQDGPRTGDRALCRDCEDREDEIELMLETGPGPETYSVSRLIGPESEDDARRHREATKEYEARLQSVWRETADEEAEYQEALSRWRLAKTDHTDGLKRLVASWRMGWFAAVAVSVSAAAIWIDASVAFWTAIGGIVGWGMLVGPVAGSVADRRLSPDPGPRPGMPPTSSERLRRIRKPEPLPNGPAGLTVARWEALCSFFGGCAYCGDRMPSAEQYQIEHVLPFSHGGDHSIGNVVPACRRCNLWKATLSGERYVQRLERTGRAVNPRWYEWDALEDKSEAWRQP